MLWIKLEPAHPKIWGSAVTIELSVSAFPQILSNIEFSDGALMAIAQYLAEMWSDQRPTEAQKAEIIANRMRNEGLGI